MDGVFSAFRPISRQILILFSLCPFYPFIPLPLGYGFVQSMPDATCLGKNRFLVASERLYDEGVNESKAGKKCILHAVLGLSMSADEINGINCFPVLPLGGVAAEGRRAAMPHHGTWDVHHAISQLDGPLA